MFPFPSSSRRAPRLTEDPPHRASASTVDVSRAVHARAVGVERRSIRASSARSSRHRAKSNAPTSRRPRRASASERSTTRRHRRTRGIQRVRARARRACPQTTTTDATRARGEDELLENTWRASTTRRARARVRVRAGDARARAEVVFDPAARTTASRTPARARGGAFAGRLGNARDSDTLNGAELGRRRARAETPRRTRARLLPCCDVDATGDGARGTWRRRAGTRSDVGSV